MAQKFHGQIQPAEIVERSVEALITKFPESFRRVTDQHEVGDYATFDDVPGAVILAVLKHDPAWQEFAKRLVLRAWALSHALIIHFEGNALNLACLPPYQGNSYFAEPVIGGYVAPSHASQTIYIYGAYSRRKDKVSKAYITKTTFYHAENLELQLLRFQFEFGRITAYSWLGNGEGCMAVISLDDDRLECALPMTSASFSEADNQLHDRIFGVPLEAGDHSGFSRS